VCRATSSPSFSTCLTSISPSRRIVWTSLGWAGGVFRASVSCQVVANAIVVLSPAPDGFFHSTSPPLLAAAQRAVVLGGVEREGVADTHLPRCVPPPTPPPPALPCRMARGNLAAAGPSQGSMQVIQGVFGAPPGGAVLSPREGAPPCRSVRSHAPPVFTPNATVTSPSPPPRLTSLPS
jgi:hypothetical protein